MVTTIAAKHKSQEVKGIFARDKSIESGVSANMQTTDNPTKMAIQIHLLSNHLFLNIDVFFRIDNKYPNCTKLSAINATLLATIGSPFVVRVIK